MDAGMNVARLNFDPMNSLQYLSLMKSIREALAEKPERSCAVLLDLKSRDTKEELLIPPI